jgi:hypothetical protein
MERRHVVCLHGDMSNGRQLADQQPDVLFQEY